MPVTLDIEDEVYCFSVPGFPAQNKVDLVSVNNAWQ